MVIALVVDDSLTSRSMFSDILKKRGVTVIEAANGKEAIELLKEDSLPEFIITDLIMPEMNGYELCRWLKNQPRTQNIPVLLCSTKNEEFDRYWGMKQGADGYLCKPFSEPELLKSIKSIL